ncbi:MAG TPA: hypothetical protein VGO66_04575 [Solirubrobacterales bacterium]|nr:hypothetical protein [Solirubrobacterales bacterium]
MRKLVFILFLVMLLAGAEGSASAAGGCPGFRVLHDDRIGAAELPAGNYTIAVGRSSELSCFSASKLFTRFLSDYDGVLPGGWSVVAQGSGKASFRKGGVLGFSVAKGGKEGGEESFLGALCSGTFTVNSNAQVGPLTFRKGGYLLYLPPLSALSCNRASVLFTRFLGAGGTLPSPWKVTAQTATFYKSAHPQRSAFRVEPLAGASS